MIHAVAIKIDQSTKAGDAADKTRQFKEVFRGEWNYRVNNKNCGLQIVLILLPATVFATFAANSRGGGKLPEGIS